MYVGTTLIRWCLPNQVPNFAPEHIRFHECTYRCLRSKSPSAIDKAKLPLPAPFMSMLTACPWKCQRLRI